MITLLAAIIIIQLATTVYLAMRVTRLQSGYGEFLDKQNPKSIEQLLKSYHKEVVSTGKKLDELADFSANLHKLSSKGLTKIGLVRFNPFADKGGDQSFCLAALNRHLDGFIISSIHTRTGARLYAKEITEGKSNHHLSDEEMRAIQKAISPRTSS